MSRLSDRLNEAKPGISIRDAVERAQRDGHAIDRGTVYRYLKGDHAKSPGDDTLAGLAAVFGLRVTELRRLADLPAGELGPYEPPAYANQLNKEQRRALDALIWTIVEGARSAPPRPNPGAAAEGRGGGRSGVTESEVRDAQVAAANAYQKRFGEDEGPGFEGGEQGNSGQGESA